MTKIRVILSFSPELLAAADRQAAAEYMSRSELIRRALLEYLRPDTGEVDERELYTDPDELLRVLQHRKMRISIHKMLKDRRRLAAER